MTVASEVNRSGPYTGNGVTTIFNYGFRIVDENHLRVVRQEAGVETPLVIDTDYIVSDVGADGGGQIAMVAAPTASQTITIVRNVPFTQETDLENQGAYFAETIERSLDLAAMRDQQLSERVDRALLVSEGSNYPGMTVPEPEAGKFLKWKQDLTGLENSGAVVTPPESYMIATQSEAEGGTINTALMTPLRTSQQITARIASQAEAVAGVSDTKLLTPLLAAANNWQTPPTLPSRVALLAANVHADVEYVLCAGALSSGDGLPEIFGRVATPGSVKSYHVQSADGAWWAPTGKIINLATWGAPMNGTDAYQAVQDALDKIEERGGGAIFHPGGTITNVSKLRWRTPSDLILFGVGDKSLFKANGMELPMFQSNGGTGAGAARRYRQHIRDFAIDNTIGPAAVGCIAWDWRNVSLGSYTNINIYNVEVGMQFYADEAAGAGCYYIDGRGSRVNNCDIGYDYGLGANENASVACSVNGARIGLREQDTSHNVHVKLEATVCSLYNIQLTGQAYDCNLISPRIENIAPANGTGIKIASTVVNASIYDPQYTQIATPLDNASASTKVNGRKSLRFTVDRGSIPANSTDDYAVSLPGFVRDADAVEITPGYNIPAGLIMQALPSSGAVYSRTANIGSASIDPPSMSHLLTWWKPGGD